MRVSLWLLQGI